VANATELPAGLGEASYLLLRPNNQEAMTPGVAKRAPFGASNNRILLRIDQRLDASTAATPSNMRTLGHHVEAQIVSSMHCSQTRLGRPLKN
jgi:hypothetical protein